MKTTKLLALAAAASCLLGASAFAAPPPANPEKMPRTADGFDFDKPARTWDAQPKPLRVIGYPVVFLGRVGHTFFRSPQILSEAIEGDRPLVSKRGLLAIDEGRVDRR